MSYNYVMNDVRSNSKSNSGMTLVEVLVAVGIFVVIMGAVAVFEKNVFSYQRSVSGSYIPVQDAQTILKTMSRELRMATQGADGAYAIQTAATNTIVFFADVAGDGVKKRIKYWYVPANAVIYKTITTPSGTPPSYNNANTSTTTLIVNVRNATSTPVFEYFDGSYNGNGNALAQPVITTAIRSIRINVTLDADPKQPPEPKTYGAQTTLRNLKDNL